MPDYQDCTTCGEPARVLGPDEKTQCSECRDRTEASVKPPLTPVEVMARHKITIQAVFVPWSKSRNYKEGAHTKDKSLNWAITLLRDGRPVLLADYSAGIGHCPSYKQMARWTRDYDASINHECEKGTTAPDPNKWFSPKGTLIRPKDTDVLHSLVMDSDVINHATYEDWASDFGYDPDSRKGEAVYRACLEIALKLRAGLGNDAFEQLRDAFQDY